MKVPTRLQPLVDDGLIDEVLSQLMSGKEAQVYVVRCGQHVRCAKIYKEAGKRSFKQAVQYQEGRAVKNSRSARAMNKRSRYGQQEQEQAWLNAEVDALRRLAAV
ncbi:MAG: serine protein kinase RIO, partial [Pseudohongiellaceae bacterium]